MARVKKSKYLFCVQKGTSKRRGIDFNFTYEEWLSWWETNLGPNWMSLRGCKRGQYVMARRGDRGSYEIGNVECLTVEENYRNRGKSAKRKLSETDARKIKYSTGKSKLLASRYGVARSTIDQIRRGDKWKDL